MLFLLETLYISFLSFSNPICQKLDALQQAKGELFEKISHCFPNRELTHSPNDWGKYDSEGLICQQDSFSLRVNKPILFEFPTHYLFQHSQQTCLEVKLHSSAFASKTEIFKDSSLIYQRVETEEEFQFQIGQDSYKVLKKDASDCPNYDSIYAGYTMGFMEDFITGRLIYFYAATPNAPNISKGSKTLYCETPQWYDPHSQPPFSGSEDFLIEL